MGGMNQADLAEIFAQFGGGGGGGGGGFSFSGFGGGGFENSNQYGGTRFHSHSTRGSGGGFPF